MPKSKRKRAADAVAANIGLGNKPRKLNRKQAGNALYAGMGFKKGKC